MGSAQNALDRSLLILGNWIVNIARLFSWSYLVMYVWRHRTGPLSGIFAGSGQMSFWK